MVLPVAVEHRGSAALHLAHDTASGYDDCAVVGDDAHRLQPERPAGRAHRSELVGERVVVALSRFEQAH